MDSVEDLFARAMTAEEFQQLVAELLVRHSLIMKGMVDRMNVMTRRIEVLEGRLEHLERNP